MSAFTGLTGWNESKGGGGGGVGRGVQYNGMTGSGLF